jgi:hypothetical protein
VVRSGWNGVLPCINHIIEELGGYSIRAHQPGSRQLVQSDVQADVGRLYIQIRREESHFESILADTTVQNIPTLESLRFVLSSLAEEGITELNPLATVSITFIMQQIKELTAGAACRTLLDTLV